MKLAHNSFDKVTEELYRLRDKCGDLPELQEIEMYKHVSEDNQDILKKVFDYLDEVYTGLDECGHCVRELSKE